MTEPVVVILAAGEGTRMRSETPKLLHPICGRPMIAWAVEAARKAGAGKVVVVDNPRRRLDEVIADGSAGGGSDAPDGDGPTPVPVVVAIQEQPRGTADAVSAARADFDGAEIVIVLNGDVPLVSEDTIRGLAEAHRRSGAAATITTTVLEDPAGYGRVLRAADGSVERVVETKTAGDASAQELAIKEVNVGIYAFDGRLLGGALERVGSDNAQGELYLPDVPAILRADGGLVATHEIADREQLIGINDRVALAGVRAVAQRHINERHMLAGVTIIDPASTVIDVDVEIGRDAVIAPFSSLHGATRIGTGARIGPLTTLIDTEVGEESSVVHSYAQGAEVGARVSVGPFAYLRPGAILREHSKAGTFVEIKNSEVGPGSKVPHLSYIGDTQIGEKTNIGAGTITANYDGTNKHRTTIGDGVFVGVDTMLVAPVTLGDSAYTAAGSVITRDVPPEALGVGRARQQNIDNYAERRRTGTEDKSSPPPESASPPPESASPPRPGVH